MLKCCPTLSRFKGNVRKVYKKLPSLEPFFEPSPPLLPSSTAVRRAVVAGQTTKNILCQKYKKINFQALVRRCAQGLLVGACDTHERTQRVQNTKPSSTYASSAQTNRKSVISDYDIIGDDEDIQSWKSKTAAIRLNQGQGSSPRYPS